MAPTLFEPGPDERVAIAAVIRFWLGRGERSFQSSELLDSTEVRGDARLVRILSRWLSVDETPLVLGELVLEREGASAWSAEITTPGSPYYLAFRIQPQARRSYSSDAVLPVSHSGFISLVYRLRRDLLDGKKVVSSSDFVPAPVPRELLDYVVEHLTRCGLGGLRADVRSISEICDIFDEYEFRGSRDERSERKSSPK